MSLYQLVVLKLSTASTLNQFIERVGYQNGFLNQLDIVFKSATEIFETI